MKITSLKTEFNETNAELVKSKDEIKEKSNEIAQLKSLILGFKEANPGAEVLAMINRVEVGRSL